MSSDHSGEPLRSPFLRRHAVQLVLTHTTFYGQVLMELSQSQSPLPLPIMIDSERLMSKCGPVRDWIPKGPCGNNQRGPTLFSWTVSLVRSLLLTAVSCEKESWQCGGGWATHGAWRWSQHYKRRSEIEKLGSGYNIHATGSSTAWIISGSFRSVIQELPSSLPFLA